MNDLFAPATLATCLPNTERATGGDWYGVAVTTDSNGRKRNVYVTHGDEDSKDDYGHTGTAKRFGNDADALNAALRLTKAIIAGQVNFSRVA